MKPKPSRCLNCRRSERTGARFATLASNGHLDVMCITCRFAMIDGKHASTEGIRHDMTRAGIPVSGSLNSASLIFPRTGLDEDDDE
jgi:hypothetical protein